MTTILSGGGAPEGKTPMHVGDLGYCRACGWLVADVGQHILPEHDVPRQGARPQRCDDGPCDVKVKS